MLSRFLRDQSVDCISWSFPPRRVGSAILETGGCRGLTYRSAIETGDEKVARVVPRDGLASSLAFSFGGGGGAGWSMSLVAIVHRSPGQSANGIFFRMALQCTPCSTAVNVLPEHNRMAPQNVFHSPKDCRTFTTRAGRTDSIPT